MTVRRRDRKSYIYDKIGRDTRVKREAFRGQ